MTGRDLVSAALRLIGAIAPGESVQASEAVDGLASINRMIDSWSNESLLIYDQIRETFSLIASQQAYTFGTGGNFNSARPVRIDSASIIVNSREYPMRVVNADQWANIQNKALLSNIPSDIYIEGSYPLETINLYPIPSTTNQIVIYSQKPIAQILTLDTDIALPQGYERALVYNAAVELSAEYGRQVNEVVFKIAEDSKASLKRSNHKPQYLTADAAVIRAGKFNMIIGENR